MAEFWQRRLRSCKDRGRTEGCGVAVKFSIEGVEGLPEIARGDDLAALIAGRRSSPTATSWS